MATLAVKKADLAGPVIGDYTDRGFHTSQNPMSVSAPLLVKLT